MILMAKVRADRRWRTRAWRLWLRDRKDSLRQASLSRHVGKPQESIHEATLTEIANAHGLSLETIRQTQIKALAKVKDRCGPMLMAHDQDPNPWAKYPGDRRSRDGNRRV